MTTTLVRGTLSGSKRLYVDTLTPLQYDVGKVKREREGFGEVRSIVVEDGRLA